LAEKQKIMNKKTGEQIINKFETYTDDTTNLSTEDELSVLNNKLTLIYEEQAWEFLRKVASGSIGVSNKIYLPNDFNEFMENYDLEGNGVAEKVVIVGIEPFLVIPQSQRNNAPYPRVCWINSADNSIEFSVGGLANQNYSFDYKYIPVELKLNTVSALPSGYDEMMPILQMLMDEEVISKSEKARSNMQYNSMQYQKYLTNLKLKDAKIKL
jgi:hypothetical protein